MRARFQGAGDWVRRLLLGKVVESREWEEGIMAWIFSVPSGSM